MSANLAKAFALSRELSDRFTVMFREAPALSISQSLDTLGNPVISINDGTPAAGEQNMVLRIVEMAGITNNSVGLAQPSYGPHIAQLVMESSATPGVAVVLSVHQMRVMSMLSKFGLRLELYLRANGAIPAVADITTGNLVTTITDLYFKMNNDM